MYIRIYTYTQPVPLTVKLTVRGTGYAIVVRGTGYAIVVRDTGYAIVVRGTGYAIGRC